MKPFSVLEAIAYYESNRFGLGMDFRQEFLTAIERVRKNPQGYAAEYADGTRVCPLHRFSYNLVYKEFPDRIWIAAVAHQKRRPRYWAGRKPN